MNNPALAGKSGKPMQHYPLSPGGEGWVREKTIRIKKLFSFVLIHINMENLCKTIIM
jgi:hypothetical protein